MNILNERQKDIIHKIFILGYTYDDLAKEYSVTRQAISQVVNTSFTPSTISLMYKSATQSMLASSGFIVSKRLA